MFVRILGGLVLLIVAIWVVLYATGSVELRRAKAEPWPYALGSLDDLAARPRRSASPEAERLIKPLESLPNGVAAATWIAAQIKKKNDAVDPVPADVASALAESQAALAELVPLVVGSGDRIVWSDRRAMAWLVAGAVNLLGVQALGRARDGDGAAAWQDVHAMWILARSLSGQVVPPAKISAAQLERIANAVARKLPAPAPPWLAEIAAIDPRRDAAAALQAQASTFGRPARRRAAPAVLMFLFRPLFDRYAAKTIRGRRAAAAAMTARRCRIDDAAMHAAEVTGMLPAQVAYRAARLDAEIEATAKVLALKSERARLGHWPPPSPQIAASRCEANVWQYAASEDGSMSLRMSLEPAWEPSARIVPQLDFAY